MCEIPLTYDAAAGELFLDGRDEVYGPCMVFFEENAASVVAGAKDGDRFVLKVTLDERAPWILEGWYVRNTADLAVPRYYVPSILLERIAEYYPERVHYVPKQDGYGGFPSFILTRIDWSLRRAES